MRKVPVPVESSAPYGASNGGAHRQRGDSARIEVPAASMLADGRLRPRRAVDRPPTSPISPSRGVPPRGPMQRLVAALEDAWATIRQHHAEIPEVVVLVGTGTDHGGALRKLGHFAARRWRLADGGERSEILVAGEVGLQATLLRPDGLASTAMLPATEARYAAVLGELTEVLVLWRASEPPRTRARYTVGPTSATVA